MGVSVGLTEVEIGLVGGVSGAEALVRRRAEARRRMRLMRYILMIVV